ncbi:phosphoenolpyruvate carboxylase [Candidatus Pacearchaeota archaeon]|nr:phosphoenolpyruvate carboxylase [Candidatus Pacearchaeota archaeon]
MPEVLKIPRCMSTQHPDNVTIPFFAENTELGGEDEIQEAYYAFSILGCDEQMWDCEGKEIDNFVVKKLLTKYEPFFRERILGKDVFLTLRVPNPTIEKSEAKILLETLESIPRSFDAAKLFYRKDIAPIFEVILPMTASSKCINRVYGYYSDFVVGKQNALFKDGVTIADWIGEFKPEKINVIPLFEDMPHMLNADKIVREYLKDKNLKYQRVFLARSDPAMNYGLISAVLLNKIALHRLHDAENDIGIRIFPIIGVGSAPFRGNLNPKNIENVLGEYPYTHTFTIQSAFKYDYSPNDVRKAMENIQLAQIIEQEGIDEEKSLDIIERYSQEYQKQVIYLADIINKVARYVPSRRKRKLHIGLFGYSREVEKVKLPRAITFTAALYSLGLPPELIGLNALSGSDFDFLRKNYNSFDSDIRDALSYYNPNSLKFLGLSEDMIKIPVKCETNQSHKELTDIIIDSLEKNNVEILDENILRAAHIRKFLG